MNKKLVGLLMAFVLVLNVHIAYGKGETISIAQFPVTLNGVQIDHENTEYPLLFYRNIIYFPLTYDYMRHLGLTSSYDKKDGLTVSSERTSGGHAELLNLQCSFNNSKLDRIFMPTYQITINGKVIDNRKEEYPFFNFRGITYVPLTWKFAHDEFKWNYYFDTKNGLTIWSIKDISSIIGEDENNYYLKLRYNDLFYDALAESYSLIIKTDKSLTGPWIKCSEEEIDMLSESLPYYTAHFSGKQDEYIDRNIQQLKINGIGTEKFDSSRIRYESGVIYLDDEEVLNLDEIIESNPEYVDENQKYDIYTDGFEFSDGLEVMTLNVYYSLKIPAPYTPRIKILLIKTEDTLKVTFPSAYIDRIRFIKNPDGSWYIIELPSYTRRHVSTFGNVYYINKDGTFINYKELIVEKYNLNKFNPKILRADEKGNLLIANSLNYFYPPGEVKKNLLIKVNGSTAEEIIPPTENIKDIYVTKSGNIIYIDNNNHIKIYEH